MAKKICYQCSTENEEHYSFCKYCGAPLPVVDRAETNSVPTPQRPQATPYDTEYDGVSGKELAIYVGKNADKIMPKFFAMQLTARKTAPIREIMLPMIILVICLYQQQEFVFL